MPQVLMTFGDSNTHGSEPLAERGAYGRHPAGTRWPTVTAAALGPDWRLIEEGLPGRTTQYPDAVMGAHMDGRTGLKIALMTHGALDVLTILLGTNDVKTRFGADPWMIVAGFAGLVDIVRSPEVEARTGHVKPLLICPPPVREVGVLMGEFLGAEAKSRALAPLLSDLADARGAGFLDAGDLIETSPVDGVHWDADAHRAFGSAVAEAIAAL